VPGSAGVTEVINLLNLLEEITSKNQF
jgi:hypothetical protein